MLDVGYTPKKVPDVSGDLYDLREKEDDLFDLLIGDKFESLHNLYKQTISLKLKAPYMAYILKNWRKLSPLKSDNFETMMSFAKGGLANAWGAGVYRFNQADLQAFPFTEEALTPYYDELTKHIGISGQADDLSQDFGTDENLLKPLNLSSFATDFFDKYNNNKDYFHSRDIRIGRPRLAVLTEEHNGRGAFQYDNMEFFKPYNKAVYNPVYTLNELQYEENFHYQSGYLVTNYIDCEDHVEVLAKNLATDQLETFKAKKLILAAGALNSTKLVLKSNNDTDTKLPILDNPMVCIPMIDIRKIGGKLDQDDTPVAQVNLTYNGIPEMGAIQASIYGSTGPLRSDVTFGFPLSVSTNLLLTKYLAPAVGVVMVFYPGIFSANNTIKLTVDNELTVDYPDINVEKKAERVIMKAIRKMGYLSFEALIQYPKIGNSLHYGGTLPMRKDPKKYQTDSDGLLFGSRHVYVADGACFSSLPAKNLTLTIMANAMRIATKLKEQLD